MLPFWDAGTTAFSLVAQWMTTRKWIETWLVSYSYGSKISDFERVAYDVTSVTRGAFPAESPMKNSSASSAWHPAVASDDVPMSFFTFHGNCPYHGPMPW